MKIRLMHLRRNDGGGIDVHTSEGVFENVVENVVRCEVGRDFDYLMTTSNEYFSIRQHAVEDFRKYTA